MKTGLANALDKTRRTWVRESMVDLLAPYMDLPLVWIRENKDKLQALIERYTGDVVLKALENCLEQGKLDFFFKDFGRYKPDLPSPPQYVTPPEPVKMCPRNEWVEKAVEEIIQERAAAASSKDSFDNYLARTHWDSTVNKRIRK